jgi:hypothetical protein
MARISQLPAYDRVKHYRALAEEMRTEAATSFESAAREVYLQIAEHCEKLATEVEKRFAN